LEGVANVMELGSQDFWCPQKNLIRGLFSAFGRPEPDPQLVMTSNASQPARILYEALGISYSCVDVDGRSGTLILDLNFDTAPEEHWNKYGRKMYDKPFCVPFQEIYENMIPDEARSRYSMVIDGEILDGKRVVHDVIATNNNVERRAISLTSIRLIHIPSEVSDESVSNVG
jgi:hypothetical protein